ncbi:hypothetical protein LUZ61_002077 [Rhynchospora tenuis]|uniref:Integrase catalytic domain-containing protein n=1 Tax=Rhynchospora tenuis TaxID=198213 RepID=A0AAD5ZI77_9POAL|nr:hypothetical protein LUZ61_002077 [Rhynchospora tenuis]
MLNHENYLLWKSQILPVLRGYDLLGFVDGTRSAPSQTIAGANNILVSNPEFLQWQQQDQLILAWLLSSISPSILALVLNCETSAQVWQTLEQINTSQSLAKVLELKLTLQTAKKGSASCAQYLQYMQSIADRLRSVGDPISEHDLVAYTLQGLGSDFETFVTAISMRQGHTSMVELQSLLLAHEARAQASIRAMASPAAHITSFSPGQDMGRDMGLTSPNSTSQPNNVVFYTAGPQNGSQRYNYPSGQNNATQTYTQQSHNNYQQRSNSNRGRGGSRGRGRGRQNRNNPETENIKCQICCRWGHTAAECYRRFDIRYTGQPLQQAPQPAQQPTQQFNQQHQALLAEPVVTPNSSWFLDSGATAHVTPDINNLTSSLPYAGTDTVHIGNGAGLSILNIGSTVIYTSIKPIYLNNVLHVPKITKNLLSISQLLRDNDVIVEFSSSYCFIKDRVTHQTLLLGNLTNGLYSLQQPTTHQALHIAHNSSEVWHSRLVHCSHNVLDTLAKTNCLVINSKTKFFCEDCNKAKAHKKPFVSSISAATEPLQVVHTDLWGPAPVISNKGHRYYVHFIDEFSRFSWLYTCASKADVVKIFAEFKQKVENLLSKKIKTVQCDGGTEFKPLMHLYPAITFQVSCPYTPEQNGMAERKHRHLVELSLATMYHACIPFKYWDWIFESVNFVINRLPSSHTSPITPFEKLFQQKPDYNFLKTIGCACFPLLRPYTDHKLQPRAELCVFMGYSSLHKGYRCLHIPSDKVYISRHVTFNEQLFPFAATSSSDSPEPVMPVPNNLTILPLTSPSHVSTSPVCTTNQQSPVIQQHTQPPSHTDITTSVASHHMLTRSKTNSLRPKKNLRHQIYTATNYPVTPPNEESEPTCYTQASKSDNWRQAMSVELNALAKNATWELVLPPANAHIVGCKWLFKIKRKSDGSIERYKARLVAKGYTQEEGLDYYETFSPVIKPTTVRVVLSIAISQQWQLHQLDVNNAFLHGELQETVYMQQPPGFVDELRPNHVCHLKKALYGLKQAPRAWFQKLRTFLVANHFKPSQADCSLFIYNNQGTIIYILVYVDDIIITGNDSQAIAALMKTLDSNFSIKDLGTLNFFLGIDVRPYKNGILLSQTRYLQNILEKAAMIGAKPCKTPMQSGQQLSKFAGTVLSDPHQYRAIVGMLQYATITRPDLTFSVNKVSQFFAEPSDIHWQAVKRILRYIKGTLNLGLYFQPSNELSLHAFCDADWAGCPDDRRSTTGFAVFLGPNLISWSSKKQQTVSRSSTEAEYRSMACTTSELMWLQALLSELGHKPNHLPALWCDNLGATFLAANPVFHARTKHIELDYHFVREKLAAKQLTVNFICSADQIGDIFTKSLAKQRFDTLKDKLSLCETQLSLRGAVEVNGLDDSSELDNGQHGESS